MDGDSELQLYWNMILFFALAVFVTCVVVFATFIVPS